MNHKYVSNTAEKDEIRALCSVLQSQGTSFPTLEIIEKNAYIKARPNFHENMTVDDVMALLRIYEAI